MLKMPIPDFHVIELPEFYPEFSWYYPTCEMQTKAWFVHNADPSWVWIDAGANIGYYTILFSKLSPSGWVYSVEPTSTVDKLIHNIAHNKLSNVSVLKTCLANRSGIYRDAVFQVWGAEPLVQEFSFKKIDDLVRDLDIQRVDVIKIDVDSYDFECLLGAEETLKKYNPWVCVELNHALSKRNQHPSMVFNWLASNGYDGSLVLDGENFIFKRGTQHRAEKSFCLKFPN